MNKPQQLSEPAPDVAPLAWVTGEIRTATEVAVAGIRTFLAAKGDVEPLRGARSQVHLANGAVRMLDLRGASLLLESIEQLLKHWETTPSSCVPTSVRIVESALEAVVAYLEGLRAGRADQPIRLFPHYREVLQLAGAQRVHPADLMFPDLTRRPAFHAIGVWPMTADQLRVRRARFEGALLGFLRDPKNKKARREMRDALSDLEKLPQRGLARSFWWVMRGLLDALEADAVAIDLDLKRVLARVNLQLRRLIEGGGAVAERLLVDALYYIGRADPRVARVAEARKLYDLDALLPPDFERSRLTLLAADQLRLLRESLAEAKSGWSQAAGGGDLGPFGQSIAAARHAAKANELDPIDILLAEIETTAVGFANVPISARESLSIEVATALLLIDLGVDELPNLDERFEARARSMTERLRAAARGDAPASVEPWLTELARKAQDRLTLQTVIGEMKALLREIEQRLDRFFRDPAERGDLGALDGMIEQMANVHALLGFDDVVAALADARASVRRYTEPSAPADEKDFARLASNLGAVGFFVETLQQDADHPRNQFKWDPEVAVFSADLAVAIKGAGAEEDEHSEQAYAAEQRAAVENVETAAHQHLEQARTLATQLTSAPTHTAAAMQLQAVTQQLINDADLLDDADLKSRARDIMAAVGRLLEQPSADIAQELARLLSPKPVEAPPATAPLPATQDAADQELMAIFVDEADEVLAGIETQLGALRAARNDIATVSTVRRAFHTLKGSSRMVGLRDFGEGAWAVEQCFNAWLSQERAATEDLIALADAARTMMSGWIRRIEVNAAAKIEPQPLVVAAQRVRDGQPFAIDTEMPRADGAATAVAPPTAVDQVATFGAEERAGPPTAEPAAGVLAAIDQIQPSATEAELAPPAEVASEAAAEAAITEFAPGEAAATAAVLEHEAIVGEGEDVRRIGPVVISHGLYSVFLSEADESLRALAQDVAEWRFEPDRQVSSNAMRRAHSLAGITATVGLDPVWALADPLDDLLHEMSRLEHASHAVFTGAQFDLLERVIERVRGMLHQFAAGIYPPPASDEVAAIRELVNDVRQNRTPAVDAAAAPAAPADATDGHDRAENESPVAVEPSLSAGDVALAEQPALVNDEPSATSDQSGIEVPPGPASSLLPPASVEPPDAVAEAVAAPDGEHIAPASEAQERGSSLIITVTDEIDADLLPLFLDEANELLPAVGGQLRALGDNPTNRAPMRELMRLLHTVKGSARMAGAMRLGELLHDMETRVEAAMARAHLPRELVDDLLARYDLAMSLFEGLQRGESIELPSLPILDTGQAVAPAPAEAQASPVPISTPVSAVALGADAVPAPETAAETTAATFVRVRTEVLDKLVDQAGEVLIARSRVENHTTTLKSSLSDLNENIHRLRTQMRELEIQAEAQIQARSEKLARDSVAFDPLEFDRFTRLQELTRMIAESIEDVATIQGSMLKGLQTTEGDLSAQYRLTRELQQQLMRVRLVPFSSISERLYRVARQAGKEVGKRVNVDIRGGRTELDRVVLERMAGPFEHMVRNAIVHGLEAPQVRRAAGKAEAGELSIEVRQESNEIIIVIADDGAGLDLDRIRARALATGLLRADQQPSDRELMDLIFAPGFSTASTVTELAGRGVGMDVVRAELSAFGGRVAIASEAGRGTRFTLNLPLTLSVTQVVLATVAGRRYAIPAGMVEQVKRVRPEDVAEAIAEGTIALPPVGDVALRTMAQLLGEDTTLHQGRQVPVVLLRSGDDRMAVVADEVSSNQEVVVKNVGAQVSRLAGILGATILGNGEIVLIINPVQLIVRAPEPPRLHTTSKVPQHEDNEAPADGEAGVTLASAPLIMVVDDSLTVRRVTQRLLERSGYDVVLAKDGVDAMRQLQDIRPDVMLVDIEMPRMDGFDLTRNVRGGELTRSIPIIMITSRTADKHRRMAMELGVNAYLGKPYQEDELLALIRSYLREQTAA